MEWKNINMDYYPDIFLQDSTFDKIDLCDGELKLRFDEYGLMIFDKEKNKLFRTREAQVVFKDVELDGIIIEKQVYNNSFGKILKYIPANLFFKNIKEKRWKCEVTNEAYGAGIAILELVVYEKGNKKWFRAFLQIYNTGYYFCRNEIDYSYEVIK